MNRNSVINNTLVADGLLFATHRDRCRYLGTWSTQKPRWLKENAGSFLRIDDIQQETAQLGSPVENEDNLGVAPAGPNCETSSRDVRKDRDDVVIALVDTLPGDSSSSHQPTSLPAPLNENVPSGSTQTEPLPHAKAATSETKESGPDATPVGEIRHTLGPSGDRQRKKQKPSAGSSKFAPKLSLEGMHIVLESLREYPVRSRAAEKAGIHRKTLEYWLKCSKAGHDGYNLVWQDELWRFHEHSAAAIEEAWDALLARCHTIAMGVKYPGSEAYVTPPNGKMLRFLLELLCPEKYGKRRKVKATQRSHVLVVGEPAKKREYNTAASVQARQWKSWSRKIRNATD